MSRPWTTILRVFLVANLLGVFAFSSSVPVARAAGEVIGCYGTTSSGWKFNSRQLSSGLTDSWYSGKALCTAGSSKFIVDKRFGNCPSDTSERRYVANNAISINGQMQYGWPEAITVLRWHTNLPTDLGMEFSIGEYKQTHTEISARARYGDFDAGGYLAAETGYDTSVTLGVNKGSFIGGGTGLGTKAAFAEVKLIANIRFNIVQRICVKDHGSDNAVPVRVVTSTLTNTNFSESSGLNPWLWKVYSSDATDSSEMSIAWSANAVAITKTQLPNCPPPTSLNKKTSLRVPRKTGGADAGRTTATTTEEKTFGVSASRKGFVGSFTVVNGMSFRITWLNQSTQYDRVVCVGSGSVGTFGTLPPNGLVGNPGTTSQVPVGMVIAVNTVAAP